MAYLSWHFGSSQRVACVARRSVMPRGSNQMPNGWWVQCLEAVCDSSWAARIVIEAALQRARDEKPADQSITPAHPVDSRRCPGAGASQGHQTRTSSSSHWRFPVCRGRHVAGSFTASSPISARASSHQSNEAEVAALEEARSRLARLEAQSKMCPPDVPMSTATKTGSEVIAELEELKAKLASTERERNEALAAPGPPPIPDSMIPAELSRPIRRVVSGSQLGTRFALRDWRQWWPSAETEWISC